MAGLSGPALHWALILVAAGSNVVLNLSLRATARSVTPGRPPWEILAGLLAAPWAWLAAVSGTLLVGCFMLAIRSFSLSVTYTAITALAMVLLTAIGALAGEETMTLGRVAGLTLIVTGLVVTAWATT